MIKRVAGKGKFVVENIHSAKNLVELPADVHKKISAFYSSKNTKLTGEGFKTVRDWMNTLGCERQRKEGLKIVEHFLHGKPL